MRQVVRAVQCPHGLVAHMVPQNSTRSCHCSRWQEKRLGLPISPLCDRETVRFASSQAENSMALGTVCDLAHAHKYRTSTAQLILAQVFSARFSTLQVGFFTIIVQPTFTLMAELQHRVKAHVCNMYVSRVYIRLGHRGAHCVLQAIAAGLVGCAPDTPSDQYGSMGGPQKEGAAWLKSCMAILCRALPDCFMFFANSVQEFPGWQV